MRTVRSILLFGVAVQASPAIAADALKFGKPPEWVVPQAIPAPNGKFADAPVAILLTDQQIRFEPGKTVSYNELAVKLQTAEGLAAGNVSLPWNPATDTVTVNKLQIRRGSQVIDVLASGQTFTTMRRETNLDVAMLDGILTANMQPEGLQQGDIINLATTTEHIDPVLGKHVEGNFNEWGGSPIQLAHLHIDWPATLPMRTQAKGFTVAAVERGGRKVIDLTEKDVEPVVPPKGAPPRFNISRLGEATDFGSWADLASLMAPLYRKAETIQPTGPLHEEVEKIRSSTADPKLRASGALKLVQDRVRYVALLMGQGGYVPADAETTWSRRFGDCKGKTALLLGILHALGIEAEPIIVQSRVGDAIAERLPLLSYFDHVLVRAHIGGKTYYLDGTRTGDTDLDAIEIPDFGWGLPVVPNAELVSMVPPPRQTPIQERRVEVDASAGVYTPAAISLTEVYRGDSAIVFNKAYAGLTAAQRDEGLRREANSFFDGMQVSSSSVQFDKAKREVTIAIKGSAKLSWNKGWFEIPTSSIAFTPDWTRPAGPFHDAPIAVSHPRFVSDVATIKLPPGFAEKQKIDPPVRESLAGVEYVRSETVNGDTLTVKTSERSVVSEVPYKEALLAATRLKAIDEDDIYLRLLDDYQPSEKDVAALGESEPSSADDLVTRGNTLMNAGKFDQAIADFTKALSIDPKNVTALADRGIAYASTKKPDLADKDLDAAEAIDPERGIIYRARGYRAETVRDCKTAIDAYGKSLAVEAHNSFALAHRAICEHQLGLYVDAISDAGQALQIEPKWGELRALKLDSFARLGQSAAALHEAEQLAKQNTQTAAAVWISAGSVLALAGLQDEALKSFDNALAIKREPSTYIARAAIRPWTDYAGRLSDIEAALKLDPNDTGALSAKADLLAERGDFKAALAIYDGNLKRAHAQSPLNVGRGILLYRIGRRAEGERLLNDWRKGALTASELNEICWKKAAAGILLESALKDCKEALKINPNFIPAVDSLAFVNLRLGQFKEAVSLYDRALEKLPLPASYMGRALAYRGLGNASKASADRSEAIKRDVQIESRFVGYGLKFEEASSSPGASPH